MSKVLVAGSATVDLIFQSNALESRQVGNRWSLAHGGKYIADFFKIAFGGGGANAAVSLAYQGLDVWFLTRIGRNLFGRQVLTNLKRHHIKTTLVQTGKNNDTPVSSVIIDKTGDKTIINYRGDGDNLALNYKVKRALQKCGWLAVYSLARWPKKDKLKLLQLAGKYKKRVFLSLHGSEYKKGLAYLKTYFPYVSVIHLNAYEAADLLGKKVEKTDFAKLNLARLLNIPLVLVSCDVKGSFAYTKDRIYPYGIVKVPRVVDSTGAGDAFSSGFLGSFIKSGNIKKSLEFGAANAAAVIQRYGAQNGLIKKQ